MANIGVVLVNYKKNEETFLMAATYASYANINHVVVVNNSADRGLKKRLLEISDKIYVINNKDNEGYSRANNAGMKYLKSLGTEYYLISNNDVEITAKTIDRLLAKLKAHPEYGILAPAMCDASGKKSQLRYVPLDMKRAFLRIFRGVDVDSRAHLECTDDIYVQSFVPGSLFLASARAMEQCDYLDPNVFLYREEEILGARMQRAGYKVGVVDSLKYKHLHDMSGHSTAAYIRMYNQEFISERYFFREYLGYKGAMLLLLMVLQLLYGVSRTLNYRRHKKEYKLSIIVPVLDCPEKLVATVKSIVKQKYANWELIIQDGSKDETTKNAINEFMADSRIRYIHESDEGIYDAMNRAVKVIDGQYVLFLGAGDYLLDEDVLADINEELEDAPDILLAKVQTTVNGESVCIDRALGLYYTYRFEPVCHQAVVASRQLFAEKLFDTRYEAVADQDWLMYMTRENKSVDRLNRAIVFYEEEGFSSAKENVSKARNDLVKIHQKYYPLRWAIYDALSEAKRFYIG